MSNKKINSLSGFYEWKTFDDKSKQPYLIYAPQTSEELSDQVSITSTFYSRFFSSYGLTLQFFGARISAQKWLVKCWWNDYSSDHWTRPKSLNCCRKKKAGKVLGHFLWPAFFPSGDPAMTRKARSQSTVTRSLRGNRNENFWKVIHWRLGIWTGVGVSISELERKKIVWIVNH